MHPFGIKYTKWRLGIFHTAMLTHQTLSSTYKYTKEDTALPRLSLWKEGAHTNDYKFFDARVREMFTTGGTTINVYKYIGPKQQTTPPHTVPDATTPQYDTFNELTIEDLLWGENRNRNYDDDVYPLRGIYTLSDIDFDLSQFGLFLQNDTLFITFHLNDMIEQIGRKIMSGDVLELVHQRDFNPLDLSKPEYLKKYYVVQDAARASEGYSPTWFPHLWRVKATPMPAGQEFEDILNSDGTKPGGGNNTTYDKEIQINDAIVQQALNEVPEAGYDTDKFYTLPLNEDGSSRGDILTTADSANVFADNENYLSDFEAISPKKSGYSGYLLGDGLAPNGHNVTASTVFPENAFEGQFVLRLDYFPNRLFRFNGRKWVKIEDDVRTPQLPDRSKNQKGGFVNNTASTKLSDGTTLEQRQTLSQALAPKADN